jgi:hypothetical protein
MQDTRKVQSPRKRKSSDSVSTSEPIWYQFLFNNVSDAAFVHYGPDESKLPGTFIEVNEIACKRLGYT